MGAIDLYLELLARTLTGATHEDSDQILGLRNHWFPASRKRRAADLVAGALRRSYGIEMVRKRTYDAKAREFGLDWPARAESMSGLRRMANARFCIESVIQDGVPGDLIETGVWRGGMSIFMRGVLKAHDIRDRVVWLADSFEGLPPPEPGIYPADKGLHLDQHDILSVGVEQVRRNFERYQLLDDQVRFIVGYFRDTLPTAPVERLSVLRLDGDLYESTIQALDALYPKLQPGGYCIVDDYGPLEPCRQAVHDYRELHGLDEEIIDIDGTAVYWRKR